MFFSNTCNAFNSNVWAGSGSGVGAGVTLPPEEDPPPDVLPPPVDPPLLSPLVFVVVSVTFPVLSTLEVVSFATSCVPAGVVTLITSVVSFFTATCAFSPVVSTLLPSAPLERFNEISVAAFTSTGVLEVTSAPFAVSSTLTGMAVVVFPSTATFAGALTATSPTVPSTARLTSTAASI